jgi:hypothetical protein
VNSAENKAPVDVLVALHSRQPPVHAKHYISDVPQAPAPLMLQYRDAGVVVWLLRPFGISLTKRVVASIGISWGVMTGFSGGFELTFVMGTRVGEIARVA